MDINELYNNIGEMLNNSSSALVYILYAIIAVFVLFVIVYIVGLVKFFKKCGKPGWAAIVPYYNSYVLTEIAGLNWWWFLIYVLASASSISIFGEDSINVCQILILGVMFNVGYNTAIKFGKKEDWGWIILSTLFGKLFYAFLGLFGSSVYDAKAKVSKNGFIKEK